MKERVPSRTMCPCLIAIWSRYTGTMEFPHVLVDFFAKSFFLRLPCLLIGPTAPGVLEPRMDLSMFVGVTSLQLVDLVGPIEIPNSLKGRLQQLTIRGMLNDAADILGKAEEEQPWLCLKKIDFSQNFLKDIEHCAINHSLTSLTSLNLSHNLLTMVPKLDECLDLERLNLSFNKISDVTDIHKRVGGINKLHLQVR